jgi:hypothetical protein
MIFWRNMNKMSDVDIIVRHARRLKQKSDKTCFLNKWGRWVCSYLRSDPSYPEDYESRQIHQLLQQIYANQGLQQSGIPFAQFQRSIHIFRNISIGFEFETSDRFVMQSYKQQQVVQITPDFLRKQQKTESGIPTSIEFVRTFPMQRHIKTDVFQWICQHQEIAYNEITQYLAKSTMITRSVEFNVQCTLGVQYKDLLRLLRILHDGYSATVLSFYAFVMYMLDNCLQEENFNVSIKTFLFCLLYRYFSYQFNKRYAEFLVRTTVHDIFHNLLAPYEQDIIKRFIVIDNKLDSIIDKDISADLQQYTKRFQRLPQKIAGEKIPISHFFTNSIRDHQYQMDYLYHSTVIGIKDDNRVFVEWREFVNICRQ